MNSFFVRKLVRSCSVWLADCRKTFELFSFNFCLTPTSLPTMPWVQSVKGRLPKDHSPCSLDGCEPYWCFSAVSDCQNSANSLGYLVHWRQTLLAPDRDLTLTNGERDLALTIDLPRFIRSPRQSSSRQGRCRDFEPSHVKDEPFRTLLRITRWRSPVVDDTKGVEYVVNTPSSRNTSAIFLFHMHGRLA